ncbi:D-Ala-D-Ala carboxypeptidase family metallohydrolase [Pseudomonas sp. LS1212]|nr:D-Ala-D-Ala carboxypeptidase family metallohydrolase [Pseudomonas sp. LS1212]UVJ46464.1 D-Ala-D-Ala carboxypeptidase family metallohydrolase [Pseudomonas sp. LS1212]
MLALLLLSALVVQADERDEAVFAQWAAMHDLSGFKRMLAGNRIDAIVPLYQLLRTASDWEKCSAEPFSAPPQSLWPSVKSTLQLLKALSDMQVLGEFEMVSGYRDPQLNACAGGAPQSAHTRAFAVDLIIATPNDAAARLCAFWRLEGARWNMGLSQYASGRIHIDTAGYRTWGDDFTYKSSFCR